MTEKQAYSYTVLRYIHDVVSGERLNVGVVMHAPAGGFLKVRTRKTVDRLKQAFPDLDDAAFTDANVAWRTVIETSDGNGARNQTGQPNAKQDEKPPNARSGA